MRQGVKYGAVLIGLYLLVGYGTAGGTLLKNGANGGIGVIKALQGR